MSLQRRSSSLHDVVFWGHHACYKRLVRGVWLGFETGGASVLGDHSWPLSVHDLTSEPPKQN